MEMNISPIIAAEFISQSLCAFKAVIALIWPNCHEYQPFLFDVFGKKRGSETSHMKPQAKLDMITHNNYSTKPVALQCKTSRIFQGIPKLSFRCSSVFPQALSTESSSILYAPWWSWGLIGLYKGTKFPEISYQVKTKHKCKYS
jgi:hypothetical protein